MCSLIKSISQYKGDKVESTLSIEVDYDPKEDVVKCVNSVYVVNAGEFKTVDITHIVGEHFEGIINKVIDETDWRELYLETKFQAA